MKYFILHIVLLIESLSIAQPPLNQQNSFGRDVSLGGKIIYTDSCYYILGSAYNDVVPNHLDAVFTKFDFNGGVINQNYIYIDTLDLRCFLNNNLIETLDDTYVSVVSAFPYSYFVKYSPNGDTISTNLINEFYTNDQNIVSSSGKLIENENDSSFSGIAMIYDELTLEPKSVFYNISKNGILNYYNVYQTPYASMGYSGIDAVSLISTIDGGYLIVCSLFKSGFPVENSRRTLHFIKTDIFGNIENEYTNWENDLIYRPKSLTSTLDGGYLFCGIKGVNAISATITKANYICKLNADFSIDWEIEYGNTTSVETWSGFQDLIETEDGNFVACGREFNDSIVNGVIIKFNLQGDVIWDSYFEYVPYVGTSNIPEHNFYAIKQTGDAGFVMVGYATDMQAISEGTPGQFSWLVKTDSVGCLVPGCQDFLNSETDLAIAKISMYPNPSTDLLNIYYFNNNHESGTEIVIYNMNGELIRKWAVSSNNITYTYDVSQLSQGTYIIQIVENNEVLYSDKFVKII